MITADKGDIHVDKNVASVDGTISMSTMEGDIQVGASVATDNGDVSLTTGAGDVSVDNKVSANNGSVTVTTDKGDIKIGDNGPNERTIFANQDITVATESGTINIKGRTATTGYYTICQVSNLYARIKRNEHHY